VAKAGKAVSARWRSVPWLVLALCVAGWVVWESQRLVRAQKGAFGTPK
jgi:hypothetical protein